MKAIVQQQLQVVDGSMILDGLKECAMLTALFANVSYTELVTKAPEVTLHFSAADYERVMAEVIDSANDLDLVNTDTLELLPPPVIGLEVDVAVTFREVSQR